MDPVYVSSTGSGVFQYGSWGDLLLPRAAGARLSGHAFAPVRARTGSPALNGEAKGDPQPRGHAVGGQVAPKHGKGDMRS